MRNVIWSFLLFAVFIAGMAYAVEDKRPATMKIWIDNTVIDNTVKK